MCMKVFYILNFNLKGPLGLLETITLNNQFLRKVLEDLGSIRKYPSCSRERVSGVGGLSSAPLPTLPC